MKRKCVIFGTTDFGKMLRYYFEKYADVQIVAYTVDKAYLESDTYDGLPAVAYEEVEKAYPPTEYTMVIALGYKKMNQIRQQKFEDAKRKGYRIENFVHPSVVDESVAMGEGILFSNMLHWRMEQRLEIPTLYGTEASSHESEVGDYNFFSVDSVIAGKTVVKNNCFLGINSTVLGNRTLEYATLVGAGAFVKENTAPYSVYVPARSICPENKKVQRWLIRDKEKGVHRSDFNTLENLICEMIEWIFHL